MSPFVRRPLITLSLFALLLGLNPLRAEAVVMLFNETFDTDTANAEVTYPALTLSGGSASVSGGVVHLTAGGVVEFTIPGYSGDVVIEGDMGGKSDVIVGGSRAEFRLGGVQALFHPGYGGGAFRLEGNVSQSNVNMPFTPALETLHHFTARSYGNGVVDLTIQNGDSPFEVFPFSFTDVPSVGQPIGFRFLGAGTGIFDNLSVRFAADLLADPAINSTINLSGGLQEDYLKLSNNGLTASALQVTGFTITGANASNFDLPGFTPSTLTVGGSNNTAYDMLFSGVTAGDYSALLTLNTNIGDFTFDLQSTVIPEPSSLGLLCLGSLLLLRRRSNRRTGAR